MDLCRRIRQTGRSILYHPRRTIIHLGGQSTHKRFPPLTFALDGQITRYRYLFKYYGARRCARLPASVAWRRTLLRPLGYGLLRLVKPTE